MSDASVAEVLRSSAPLVLIEAPAGCGKTFQGSTFVTELCRQRTARCLVLTHTHAARSVFVSRIGSHYADVRTIDSLIVEVATTYAAGLGLPADAAAWARQQRDGYSRLAAKVRALLIQWPMIARALAQRFPIVACDEHQDSSGDQHAIVMALLRQGARIRIFADPLQKIFRENEVEGSAAAWSWDELKASAQFDQLDYPHRWEKGCKRLGRWLLDIRERLASDGAVDLRPGKGIPDSVSVLIAENSAQAHDQFRVDKSVADQIYSFARSQSSLLVLTRNNDLARALCGFFNRSIPLWEGHVREATDLLATASIRATNDPPELARAVSDFLAQIGVGFTFSGFGDILVREATQRCNVKTRGKPQSIQEIARCLIEQPNHKGIGRALKRVKEIAGKGAFVSMKIDKYRELSEATRFADHETVDEALRAITQRRAHGALMPPAKAISNIHKAKGLESSAAMIINCTKTTFPDTAIGRRTLYVGLTRASTRLLITVSAKNPSPLFRL